MPSFQGRQDVAPFGRNQWLRSTQDVKTESYTVAKGTVTAEVIDGNADQKVLQPGTVMAKITSGADAGKIGPFEGGNAPTNETQTIDLGGATAGSITIEFDGEVTGSIAFNASNATVQAELEGLSNIQPGDVIVSGGPLPGTITLTFGGQYENQNVPEVVVTPTGLTGGTVTVATTQQGGYTGTDVTDGRQDPANIVGICNTFLPWQLKERDVEVAVVYEATAVQAWCFEYDAAGARTALSDATANAMRGQKNLDIMFA